MAGTSAIGLAESTAAAPGLAARVTEALSGLDREPSWWGALYDAMYGVFGQDPYIGETSLSSVQRVLNSR